MCRRAVRASRPHYTRAEVVDCSNTWLCDRRHGETTVCQLLSRGVRGEVAERRRPLASAGVEDNVMAFTDEGTGGGAAESVGGAGDEDTGHGIILPSVVCQAPDSGSDPERSPLPRVVLRRQPGNQDRGARRWSASGQDAKNEVLEHCRRAAESSAAEVTRSTPAPARPGARRHQRAPRRGSRAARGRDFRRFRLLRDLGAAASATRAGGARLLGSQQADATRSLVVSRAGSSRAYP